MAKAKAEPKQEEKATTIPCFIARDRAGGLVGIYSQKPQEVTVKDSNPAEPLTYYRAPAGCLLHTLPAATFFNLFKIEIGLGECYATDLGLLLKV